MYLSLVAISHCSTKLVGVCQLFDAVEFWVDGFDFDRGKISLFGRSFITSHYWPYYISTNDSELNLLQL